MCLPRIAMTEIDDMDTILMGCLCVCVRACQGVSCCCTRRTHQRIAHRQKGLARGLEVAVAAVTGGFDRPRPVAVGLSIPVLIP
eukprot:COSAG05_NODE_3982_length_1740_cov_1.569165_2_plen_84_part_00